MNKETVKWCRQHDWGHFAMLANGRIFALREISIGPDGEVEACWRSFGSFSEIREWAGY